VKRHLTPAAGAVTSACRADHSGRAAQCPAQRTLLSPLQFQKRIRLQEARALLIAGADDVARVGSLVGYASPTQFNREYRRLFGYPPGQDAERLRETVKAV
jgi:transcriptional regulator GlxA family with amidase domain